MKIFLAILLVLLAIGALIALIRGIVTFLKTTEADLRSGQTGPSQSSLKQNRLMMQRIMFQAGAILIAALLLLLMR